MSQWICYELLPPQRNLEVIFSLLCYKGHQANCASILKSGPGVEEVGAICCSLYCKRDQLREGFFFAFLVAYHHFGKHVSSDHIWLKLWGLRASKKYALFDQYMLQKQTQVMIFRQLSQGSFIRCRICYLISCTHLPLARFFLFLGPKGPQQGSSACKSLLHQKGQYTRCRVGTE